jgi:hypothetical protein
MSELREKIADAIAGAVSQDDRYLEHADAVLRVLAEHGDTQQVREQIADTVRGSVLSVRQQTDKIMAVVAPIVAARDAAVEQLGRSLAAQELMATQFRTMQREKEHGWREAERFEVRAEHAEAHLAAARMALRVARHRLDKVRALAEQTRLYPDTLRAILDAPARPAGHDERLGVGDE